MIDLHIFIKIEIWTSEVVEDTTQMLHYRESDSQKLKHYLFLNSMTRTTYRGKAFAKSQLSPENK